MIEMVKEIMDRLKPKPLALKSSRNLHVDAKVIQIYLSQFPHRFCPEPRTMEEQQIWSESDQRRKEFICPRLVFLKSEFETDGEISWCSSSPRN